MHLDFSAISARSVYKLLMSVVVPRPIALVTTIDADGQVNAAPFSYFNAVSAAPPTVVLGVGPSESGGPGPKDTLRNIEATGEFVVNMVDEAMADRMNVTAYAFPPGTSELDKAGLTARPAVASRPPLITESPVSLECRLAQAIPLGPNSTLLLGRVGHLHIRDELIDPERHYVLAEDMHLIARMHGRGWYARTTDLFEIHRLKEAP